MTAFVWLLLVLSPVQEGDFGRGREALEAGQFGAARAQFETVADPRLRGLGLAELFYRAGDPRRSLESAQAGLVSAAEDLELLHRAAACSLWLGDGERTMSYARRLLDAVGAADLSPEHRPAWEQAAERFRTEGSRLVELENERREVLARGRWVSIAIFVGVAAGALIYRLSPHWRP